MSIPVIGNVIAIYTKAGKGIFGVQKPKGILNFSIPVFAVQKEFYEPKYKKAAQKNSEKPDLRSLIFWQPLIVIDGADPYSTSFYNPDTTGEKIIVVEAIDSKGRLGYKTFTYDVIEDY